MQLGIPVTVRRKRCRQSVTAQSYAQADISASDLAVLVQTGLMHGRPTPQRRRQKDRSSMSCSGWGTPSRGPWCVP